MTAASITNMKPQNSNSASFATALHIKEVTQVYKMHLLRDQLAPAKTQSAISKKRKEKIITFNTIIKYIT